MIKQIFFTIFLLVFAVPAYAIDISSCGQTLNSEGSTYDLTQNISDASGYCLYVTANDITINTGIYSITYGTSPTANSGGISVSSGVTGLEINGTGGGAITQGSTSTDYDMQSIYSSGQIVADIHHLTFTIEAGGGHDDTAACLDASSTTSGHFRNNIVNVSGGPKRFMVFEYAHNWKIHNNRIVIDNYTYDGAGNYPFISRFSSGIEFYENTVITTSGVGKVDGIACYDGVGSNAIIRNNNFIWHGNAGRILHVDKSCSSWRVYENTITATGNATVDVLNAIRWRIDIPGGDPLSDNEFYNNTIDFSEATGGYATPLVIGDDPGNPDDEYGTKFYLNIVKGGNDVVSFYAPSNVQGFDAYCNQFEYVRGSTGYIVEINGNNGIDNTFSYNLFATNASHGDKVYTSTDQSAEYVFCENSTFVSGEIGGGGDVDITSAPCQNGSASCWTEAGVSSPDITGDTGTFEQGGIISITGTSFGIKEIGDFEESFDGYSEDWECNDSDTCSTPGNWGGTATSDSDETDWLALYSDKNMMEIVGGDNKTNYSTGRGFRTLMGKTDSIRDTYGIWNSMLTRPFGEDTSEIWLRYYVKYGDDTYPFPTPSLDNAQHKNFWVYQGESSNQSQFILSTKYYSQTYRYSFYALHVQNSDPINIDDADRGDSAWVGSNKWHEIKLRLKMNTALENTDGELEYWYNGVKLIDATDQRFVGEVGGALEFWSFGLNGNFRQCETFLSGGCETSSLLGIGEFLYIYKDDIVIVEGSTDPGSIATVYLSNESVWGTGVTGSERWNGNANFVRQTVGGSDSADYGFNSWSNTEFMFEVDLTGLDPESNIYLYVINWKGEVSDGYDMGIASVSVAISLTGTGIEMTKAEAAAGGANATIDATVSEDVFDTDVCAGDNQKTTDFLAGFVGDLSEGGSWNNQVSLAYTDCSIISTTIRRIVIPANSLDITQTEQVTLTAHSTTLVGGETPIATPNIIIYDENITSIPGNIGYSPTAGGIRIVPGASRLKIQ